ncbi:MAG: ImmA/IrrE family metallo-endopeptidase [Angelakisella sp.]|nr:ImmA/IrrE family metallo-endopeptidase [Angelakisella sp.]
MILSHAKLEEMAMAVTDDFNRFFFGINPEEEKDSILPTMIDQFAKEYLDLQVSFAHLSSDGSVCGVTAYSDTQFILEEKGRIQTIPLREGEVVLDDSFIQPGQVKRLCGKRRFTLAHECAHQILFQMESEEIKSSCRKSYSPRKAYSLRDLKTREDWNEWQANVLGAAILMPQREISFVIRQWGKKSPFKNYQGRFTFSDQQVLDHLCQSFGASRSAMVIRLRELGYLEDHPSWEFCEPPKIRWA